MSETFDLGAMPPSDLRLAQRPRRSTLATLRRLLWIGTFLSAALPAQETSVAPGINSRFEDPDADVSQFVAMFEGESRVIYKERFAIVDALGLAPEMNVADVGAGTGLFTRLIAERVGPRGKVFAVDISEPMLEHIRTTSNEAGLENVETILGGAKTTHLEPRSVDLVFVCDTYHHFEYPDEILASIHRALRPGGSLVIVDFERVEGKSSSFAVRHLRAGKGTFSDEIKDAGFDFVEEVPLMEEQYFLRFSRRENAADL